MIDILEIFLIIFFICFLYLLAAFLKKIKYKLIEKKLNDAIDGCDVSAQPKFDQYFCEMNAVCENKKQDRRVPVSFSITNNGQHVGNCYISPDSAQRSMDMLNNQYPETLRSVVPLYE